LKKILLIIFLSLFVIFFLNKDKILNSFNVSNISLGSDPKFELGKKVFLNNGKCAGCHTLSDALSYSKIGPNLDSRKPSKSRVMIAVMEGVGVMPSLEGTLSKVEMEAVAEYVYQTTKE
jgi:mono/diheme cytochrome c family protein